MIARRFLPVLTFGEDPTLAVNYLPRPTLLDALIDGLKYEEEVRNCACVGVLEFDTSQITYIGEEDA